MERDQHGVSQKEHARVLRYIAVGDYSCIVSNVHTTFKFYIYSKLKYFKCIFFLLLVELECLGDTIYE